MLSIDKINEELAEEYPDLPIAFAYSGTLADTLFVLKNKERFEKVGGVIRK